MALPGVDRNYIIEAFEIFDRNYRQQSRWANFTANQNHKYAVQYDGELYPVKQIIRLAVQEAGYELPSFSGGKQANDYLRNRGFTIVYLDEYRQREGRLLLKSEVNRATFNWGLTIPASHQQDFYEALGLKSGLSPGTTREIKLFIAGKEFSAKLSKVKNKANLELRYSDNDQLKEFLKSQFSTSYQYIVQQRQRQLESGENQPQVEVPTEKCEYLKFYSSPAYEQGLLVKLDRNIEPEKRRRPKKERRPEKILPEIKNYIAAQGFNYPTGLVENFYLSLKTKPFVLLAGISGTGKTKLAQLFGEAIGCTRANGRFQIIPVRPDWSDPSDLLGYKDLEGNFRPGPLIDIINRANSNPAYPHLVCLDEMNLARVEYYFSDLLSAIETRKRTLNGIQSEVLLPENYFTKAEDAAKYANLRLPDNLYLIGTVNMDETTHPFSKKVLDRANTIEFSQVKLGEFNLNQSPKEPLGQISNQFLAPEYLTLNTDCSQADKEVIKTAIDKLQVINKILKLDNLHVGYRVRDEICFYLIYNKRYELLEFNEAFDYQLQQKILPRIQGSSQLIKEILVKLFNLSSKAELETSNHRVAEKALKYLKTERVKPYPKSAEKLAYMIKRFEKDGFTAYWL